MEEFGDGVGAEGVDGLNSKEEATELVTELVGGPAGPFMDRGLWLAVGAPLVTGVLEVGVGRGSCLIMGSCLTVMGSDLGCNSMAIGGGWTAEIIGAMPAVVVGGGAIGPDSE